MSIVHRQRPTALAPAQWRDGRLSALAIAVSNAGGLGSLPCAMLTPESIGNELARAAEFKVPEVILFRLSLEGTLRRRA